MLTAIRRSQLYLCDLQKASTHCACLANAPTELHFILSNLNNIPVRTNGTRGDLEKRRGAGLIIYPNFHLLHWLSYHPVLPACIRASLPAYDPTMYRTW